MCFIFSNEELGEKPVLPWEKMPWQVRNTPIGCPEVSVCKQCKFLLNDSCDYGRELIKNYTEEKEFQERMAKFHREHEEAEREFYRGLRFDPKRLKGT